MKDAQIASKVINVKNIQDKINDLKSQRNEIIVLLKGHITCRELGNFIGLSAAQISRIQNKKAQRADCKCIKSLFGE